MQISRDGHHYPLKSFVIWRTSVLNQLRAIEQCAPIAYPCRIEFEYYRGDNRKRDVPGMMDALFHCFERSGLIEDDKLFVETHWFDKGLDREKPRVLVQIDLIADSHAPSNVRAPSGNILSDKKAVN